MKAKPVSVFFGLFVLIVVPVLFVGGPDLSSSLFFQNIWNFGHITFFAVLLLLIQLFKPILGWKQWLWVTLIAAAVGMVIEVVQHFIGRNFSIADVMHNLYGVWLGLFFGQKSSRLVWSLRVISLLLIAPSAWFIMDSGISHMAMCAQFPQLNSFETRHEVEILRASNSEVNINPTDELHTDGSRSAHIRLGTRPYSGVSMVAGWGDWGLYTELRMDVYNPQSEPLALVVKISDYEHDRRGYRFDDRVNRRVTVGSGWNELRIAVDDIRRAPNGRLMQMDDIGNMVIFSARLSESREFYLDHIRLH